MDQTSRGAEWESTWAATDNFRLHTTLGYIDVDVDDPNPAAVAPLTPELTASISPELDDSRWQRRDHAARRLVIPRRHVRRAEQRPGAIHVHREPRPDQCRRQLPADRWRLDASALYGRNITDERYDNARLNTGDYVLVMLSNDASEFGVRFTKEF